MACRGGCAGTGASSSAAFRRVLWLALVLNAVMFVVEIVASAVSGSVSLQADALDFLGDAANYAITLLVLPMALAARARAALLKGATMGCFGLWVISAAVHRAVAGEPPDWALMGVVGLVALAVNVGVAVLLFRYRDGDSNVRSIWLCTRNDAIGNVAVMLAAAGVVASGSGWPDILVAGLIASLCLTSAVSVIRQALGELRGRAHPRAAPAEVLD